METLPRNVLYLAESLASRTGAGTSSRLWEALEDYRNACQQLQNDNLSVIDRKHWLEIRTELVNEVTRLALQLSDSQASAGSVQ